MSTRSNFPATSKKLSCCVRPGVCEVRASVLRPVSALTRLDLPTFERPAKAISTRPIGGRFASESAAQEKSAAPAKSLRPASRSSSVRSAGAPILARPRSGLRGGLAGERAAQVVPQFHLHAALLHDEVLLRDREEIVPGPVD